LEEGCYKPVFGVWQKLSNVTTHFVFNSFKLFIYLKEEERNKPNKAKPVKRHN